MLPPIPDIQRQIWSLAAQIPSGRVATYGAIARALGDLSASRTVGEVMVRHDHREGCVCHRLVRSDLTLGKYVSGNTDDKARSLGQEGVSLRRNRITDPGLLWDAFSGPQPLQCLSDYQRQLAKRVDTACKLAEVPRTVGGLDVSFVPKSNLAVAAFVEVDWVDREVIYQKTSVATVTFPYISGYLAFRELPLLLELVRAVRAERGLPAVTMVDGSGILHPRRAGVATMLGVEAGMVTVGLTKKQLVGRLNQARLDQDAACEISVEGELNGYALLPGSGTGKPLFVSPGHRIDVASALSVLRACCCGRRLPEPIYWADRISRKVARQDAKTRCAHL